jgi:hypothetical protein
MTVADMAAERDRMILDEVVRILAAERKSPAKPGGWVSSGLLVIRVRSRYPWATSRQVLSVVDAMWEAEVIEPRVAGTANVNEWRPVASHEG